MFNTGKGTCIELFEWDDSRKMLLKQVKNSNKLITVFKCKLTCKYIATISII